MAFLLLMLPADLVAAPDRAALIVALRPFVALAGVGVVAVVVAVLRSSGLRRAAVVAGLLLALDPFAIRFDTRLMLEAFAQLAVVAMVAAAVQVARGRGRRWVAATAVAGGLCLGTKETFGMVAVATLLLVAIATSGVVRRRLLVATAGSVGGYVLVNGAMAAWAGPELWWAMRLTGLQRLLGVDQATGFNAPDAEVSLWDRVLPNVAEVGITYVVLVAGGLCALTLCILALRARRPGPLDARQALQVVVAAWATASWAYVTYAVVLGSLEEQMFYIALAPSVVALAVVLDRARLAVAVPVVAVVLLGQVASWVVVHTQRDDVYLQMFAWAQDHVPEGSTILVTEDSAQFLLHGYRLSSDPTTVALGDTDYVLLSPVLVAQGYGVADQGFVDDLRDHGTLVHTVVGRENTLELWDVQP
nr:glycosyltransferase family 39 protein [Cellulomonas humilata]